MVANYSIKITFPNFSLSKGNYIQLWTEPNLQNMNKENLTEEVKLSHEDRLVQIRKKCLNSNHPLRFIDYAIEEKWYMNELILEKSKNNQQKKQIT